MIAVDWKFKEIGLKVIYKFTEKFIDVNVFQESEFSMD